MFRQFASLFARKSGHPQSNVLRRLPDDEPPKDDPRHRWRMRAGNHLMYDTIGSTQFAILTLFFGLRERHGGLVLLQRHDAARQGLTVSRAARPWLSHGRRRGTVTNGAAIDVPDSSAYRVVEMYVGTVE